MRNENYVICNKEPGVAAILNMIMPGLGYIYCERILGGLISMSITIGIWVKVIEWYSYRHYSHVDRMYITLSLLAVWYIISLYLALFIARGRAPLIISRLMLIFSKTTND